MNKPFDLEAFKAGQKALTRDGRVATFVKICEERPKYEKLIAYIDWDDNITSYSLEGTYGSRKEGYDCDLVSMVSRHQALIDSYNPEDTWQIENCEKGWFSLPTGAEPGWNESVNYRLHPHNDLIKAYKNGAKIEALVGDKWWDSNKPVWDEDLEYRIKPTTKTVYEWMCKAGSGNWIIQPVLYTEEQAYEQKWIEYKKTGRSWVVEV